MGPLIELYFEDDVPRNPMTVITRRERWYCAGRIKEMKFCLLVSGS
jgi:hypothetical protein